MSLSFEIELLLNEHNLKATITSVKKQLAKKYMTCLNKEFVNDVRTLNFTVPKRLDGKPRASMSSHSTVDSAEQEEEDKSPDHEVGSVPPNPKRINKITELMLLFEERCFVNRFLGESELRAFRSLNRGALGRVLENYNLFKHHHSLPIAINILMFNSSKMNIPKNHFRDLVFELFPCSFNKDFSIHSIKKFKTYSLLKKVIRNSL